MSIPSLHTLTDFLNPINIYELSDDEGYHNTQLGRHITVFENEIPDIADADLVLIGCNETRGAGLETGTNIGADEVRKQLYKLYHWHKDVKLADLGNIKAGATISDSYAAVKAVVSELIQHGKKLVLLGGSHDITLAQYEAYAHLEKIIEATCVDARIDLNLESLLPEDNFLLKMLTASPNFIRHYNHIGFQSYFVHPTMLETIDKLRFDCYRVGKVKERIEEMEPAIRHADLFSFDIAAIQNSHAPANHLTPNGFNGEEACTLMQYAGMSPQMSSIGIYGYLPKRDVHQLTAKQISHMLWYLMDGVYKAKQEAPFDDRDHYNEFHLTFSELETIFLQSKRTGRWWMQLPDGPFLACSYRDYQIACNNEIPERWLRAVERG